MKIITTNDGMIGVAVNNTAVPTWHTSRTEALQAMIKHYKEDADHYELADALTKALRMMLSKGHNTAHFGVFGSLMYTTKEADNED